MRFDSRTKRWLCLYLVLAGLLSVWVPIKVWDTVFDNAPEGLHAFIWQIGHQMDGSEWGIEWKPFLIRHLILLVSALFAFYLLPKFVTSTSEEWIKVPFILYLFAAGLRLIFVPCTWSERFGFRSPRVENLSGSIPLWRIGTEHIRYGLVVFDEFALLMLLGIAYVILLTCSYPLRYRMRRWIDDWRQPWVTR